MASTRHETGIDLERLTGVRQRHVVGEGEDSYTLALGAARDALAQADCGGEDLDMLISSTRARKSRDAAIRRRRRSSGNGDPALG